jgi:hypothetical protein
MTASTETVQALIDITRKYVNDETVDQIMEDLLKVEGNASFRDTIIKMKYMLMRARSREERDRKLGL